MTRLTYLRSIQAKCTNSFYRPTHLNPQLLCLASRFSSPTSDGAASTQSASDAILLYENSNTRPGYFILISIASVIQLVFWAYLAYFALTQFTEEDAEATSEKGRVTHNVNFGGVEEDGMQHRDQSEALAATAPQRKNRLASPFASHKLRLGLSALALGAGIFFAVTACMYSLRVVHRLLFLRSAGVALAQMHTYDPLGRVRVVSVPLVELTCLGDRLKPKSMVALKAKGYPMYFLVDARGSFPLPHQFDTLIGSRRKVL